MKRAFTLIELLIVIAIIAILALIAVPNFLEAQTRAKVTRALADMRSVAVAVEAYTVDWGRPVWGVTEMKYATCYNPGGSPNNYTPRIHRALNPLTTPVAFMSSIPKDPFGIMAVGSSRSLDNPPFEFETYICAEHLADEKNARDARGLGYYWSLSSFGPARDNLGNAVNVMVGAGTSTVYDSSNGTMSRGFLIRTNKGGDLRKPE